MNARNVMVYYRKINEKVHDVTFRSGAFGRVKLVLFSVFRAVIIIGMSYIILGPVINIVSNSFFSGSDVYNPSVFMIPLNPTLENYRRAFIRLDYFRTLGYTLVYIVTITLIQIFVCSMVGYGFARFDFPLKKLLFGCVIVTIVLPAHVIMLPLYQHFRKWDVLWIIEAVTGEAANLLSSETPMYLMTLFGTGLRSGLFIYIFRQFFRGLPKEIEEAAFIDGAGPWYTYFAIMLANAMPAVITVAVFSMVWQYNDMFYARLFSMPTSHILTFRLSTLQATVEFADQVKDPLISQLAVYAGITLVLLPILFIYFTLQKYFVEGIERSGIVG
ncbi:carbohydrate ABC transporter permease [Thermoclostridium stercorarium]|uniref:carbohydrate ABC transporter permease n=1 Tax=Thermoclostridium stercorarium TaxID=1510 RepID=UPI0022493A14|nr:carbohydrate ABC transporter permease [Thermoclostridium stercorarium]UZQ86655.1 carbohydrate ABC transporter permease [Thermoclostridium stercorarium]